MGIGNWEYKERTGTDTKTLSIVNKIKKLFPDLVSSDTYTTYQGTIISKKSNPLSSKAVFDSIAFSIFATI